jgi:hypothetical protein
LEDVVSPQDGGFGWYLPRINAAGKIKPLDVLGWRNLGPFNEGAADSGEFVNVCGSLRDFDKATA